MPLRYLAVGAATEDLKDVVSHREAVACSSLANPRLLGWVDLDGVATVLADQMMMVSVRSAGTKQQSAWPGYGVCVPGLG